MHTLYLTSVTGERFLMNNQKSNRVNSWLTANAEQEIRGYFK